MTLSDIRPTLLRRAVVVLTVAALVLTLSGLWLVEAIARRVQEDFGESLRDAWGGKPKHVGGGCTCPPGKSCYERCGE
jgi:hypothetical protein